MAENASVSVMKSSVYRTVPTVMIQSLTVGLAVVITVMKWKLMLVVTAGDATIFVDIFNVFTWSSSPCSIWHIAVSFLGFN